jgi:hypothetical protein
VNWFFAIARIAGTGFPLTGQLVQLQAELDSEEIRQRLAKLEDPLSALHPEIREVSRHIFDGIKAKGSEPVAFTREFYDRYARPLALLENYGCIRGTHTNGGRFYAGMWVGSPSYMLYLCALGEDSKKMDQLLERVDGAPVGKWLHGVPLAEELSLPLPVVESVFELYADNGLGIHSRNGGAPVYYARA